MAGLADLAVLDLHLAPQLADATKEVQQPAKPQATDRSVPVKTSTPPAPPDTAAPTPVEPPPVAVATNTSTSATPTSATPTSATGATPTAAATVAAASPPTKATSEPKGTAKTPAGKGTAAPPPPPEPLEDVIFILDSHLITNPQSITELQHVARELATTPGRKLLIRGHSDQMGTPEYKRALSLRRAMTVQNFLVSHGAPADRISLEAVGDTDPADPGNNPVAWARNRRVQLVWR